MARLCPSTCDEDITCALVLEELGRRANQFQQGYVMCKIQRVAIIIGVRRFQ